jgi:ribosomal protein L27
MSHVKAGGSAKNVHDSPGQRLGVKVFGGQKSKNWRHYCPPGRHD